jgi:hypothetical protein
MFDNNDTIFINWIENLEAKCQELIFSKGQSWFETKLEKDDIESAFTSPFKIFKSGKYYLLRVNVKPNIKIYNEKDQIMQSEDITSEKNIISILEIQGIKFTSRNFQIEIELKQSMVVSPDPFLDECFIKKPIRKQAIKEDDVMETETAKSLTEFIDESAKDLAEKTDSLKPIDLEISFEKKSKTDINLELKASAASSEVPELEEANIILDVEDLEPPLEKEDPNVLKEVDLSSTLENSLETLTLKKPNQVYYEIYQKAREKAKEAKKTAIVAYLEMKNIKKTYMLDDIDESDNEFEEFSNKDDQSVNDNSDNESLEDNF